MWADKTKQALEAVVRSENCISRHIVVENTPINVPNQPTQWNKWDFHINCLKSVHQCTKAASKQEEPKFEVPDKKAVLRKEQN